MKTETINKRNLVVALVVTALFVVLNAFMLKQNLIWLSLLPLVGLVGVLLVSRTETMLMLMALLTPLAVDVAVLPGMELSMPVEPLMIAFTLLFLFRVLLNRDFDRRILVHPVSVAILAQLSWMLLTACFSELPAVSFKYFAARLWFVVPFYFAAVQIFRRPARIGQFFWCYAAGMLLVVVYATVKTLGNMGDLQVLHRVMCPFYNDHTAYGCVLGLFIPAAFYLVRRQGRLRRGWLWLLMVAAFGLMLVGIFFSYSRASWISVFAAVGVYVLIRLGMKVRWMVLMFALLIGGFFYYQSDVLYRLGKNKQDSSLDLAGQLQSISNISTDASNLERLNRWASALRIFRDDPFMGCGPGTYQFVYASYQRSYQKSVISTDFGNRGNAHSEYIGPLCEQGVPGAALVLCVFLVTFACGVRVYRTARDKDVADMALAFTLSLLTYYVHGVFNNFLDTDKLSVPFWAFTAVIVSLDLYSRRPDSSLPEA